MCKEEVGQKFGHKTWDKLLWSLMTFEVILIKWNICVII